jgi:undecaprenyl phosphate-alpha-L-ara4N flippase subunit ArnE
MNLLPWIALSLVVGLGSAGQLSLKYAFQTLLDLSVNSTSFQNLLKCPFFWIWFVCYIIVTGLWLLVLRSIPLSQAFPALGLTFALIPLGSYYLLGETILSVQWIGICTIVAGSVLVVHI